MEFRQLEAFVNAAKYKSFSKAADATFLTQPTISTHVSNLENELGVRLLNRSGREISLTPHGHEFYSYAVELLNTRSRAVMSMKNLKEDLDGILEIQTSSIPGYFYLPQVMEEFHELFPRVRFYVEQSDSRLVNENLMNQRGELGFTGVICTDSLSMQAIRDHYSAAEAAVAALNAGADLLLMPPDLPEAFDGVLEAVQNGTISEERLNESVRRILMLKQKAGLELDTRTPLEKMLDVFL